MECVGFLLFLSEEEGELSSRGEKIIIMKKKSRKVSGWMERSFSSPAARGQTHYKHGSPRGVRLLTDAKRPMCSSALLCSRFRGVPPR